MIRRRRLWPWSPFEVGCFPLAAQREDMYFRDVASLRPLKEKGYQLALLEDALVDGRPTRVVNVSHQGHGDIKLFFDKERHLLLKSEYNLKVPELGGKEVKHEILYADYKRFDGAKVPATFDIHRDGKLLVRVNITEWKAVKELDPALFARPK